ncbi:putative quinol monooxygenase [Chryseosolibacter indicus]|uniref:Antibiotic biosynthesis monooxygenase n=1 Tax=Chryseosolibacter indicus TaxID=2782351 RepID=A0ABS5VNW7_9BACT|nr:antibiotic biosynthesis monooxygenase family protein [Chryseosolibacter indicus]MBT1702530.1 antibiotic biosynthesis monooxygenase [Chryseosolibacter indicus]
MIIRVVRMYFKEEGVESFLATFNLHKEAIRSFPGCTHLELLKDAKDPNVFSTLSYWIDEDSLENYRKSDLFNSVWGNVKKLFSEKPQAFSLMKFIKV